MSCTVYGDPKPEVLKEWFRAHLDAVRQSHRGDAGERGPVSVNLAVPGVDQLAVAVTARNGWAVRAIGKGITVCMRSGPMDRAHAKAAQRAEKRGMPEPSPDDIKKEYERILMNEMPSVSIDLRPEILLARSPEQCAELVQAVARELCSKVRRVRVSQVHVATDIQGLPPWEPQSVVTPFRRWGTIGTATESAEASWGSEREVHAEHRFECLTCGTKAPEDACPRCADGGLMIDDLGSLVPCGGDVQWRVDMHGRHVRSLLFGYGGTGADKFSGRVRMKYEDPRESFRKVNAEKEALETEVWAEHPEYDERKQIGRLELMACGEWLRADYPKELGIEEVLREVPKLALRSVEMITLRQPASADTNRSRWPLDPRWLAVTQQVAARAGDPTARPDTNQSSPLVSEVAVAQRTQRIAVLFTKTSWTRAYAVATRRE